MRSTGNGALSFGPVGIPAKLVDATESHSVSFRRIHTEDGGRVRYRKFCELEEREVTGVEMGKGHEDADGAIIPITEEDPSHLPLPTAGTVETVAFVPSDRIYPVQMDILGEAGPEDPHDEYREVVVAAKAGGEAPAGTPRTGGGRHGP